LKVDDFIIVLCPHYSCNSEQALYSRPETQLPHHNLHSHVFTGNQQSETRSYRCIWLKRWKLIFWRL